MSAAEPENPSRAGHVALMRRVLAEIVSRLAPKDRLRLSCYYAQNLTLAEIGRALGEHEATVSRNLTRVRREIRTDVERHLREHEGMSEPEVTECFASVVGDAGALDVADLLGTGAAAVAAAATGAEAPALQDSARKESGGKRSKERREGASA